MPPYLVHGDNFTVREQVQWNEGMHEFIVDSDCGAFEAWGEPMLRVRLREVEAMNTMLNTSSAAVGTQVAVRQVGGSIKALGWSVRSNLRATVLPEVPWGRQDEG